MKTFQVYKHPVFGLEAVKVGVNWPVFFLGMIITIGSIAWMLVCKLWGKAILWFVLWAIAIIFTWSDGQGISLFVGSVGYFVLWLVPAFKGNAWLASNYGSRGYELVNIIQAMTKDAAIGETVRQQSSENN